MRNIQLTIAAFECGRWPGAKEGRQPLEAGKRKKMDFPLDSRKEHSFAKTLICVVLSHKVCVISYKGHR